MIEIITAIALWCGQPGNHLEKNTELKGNAGAWEYRIDVTGRDVLDCRNRIKACVDKLILQEIKDGPCVQKQVALWPAPDTGDKMMFPMITQNTDKKCDPHKTTIDKCFFENKK